MLAWLKGDERYVSPKRATKRATTDKTGDNRHTQAKGIEMSIGRPKGGGGKSGGGKSGGGGSVRVNDPNYKRDF